MQLHISASRIWKIFIGVIHKFGNFCVWFGICFPIEDQSFDVHAIVLWPMNAKAL